MKKIHIGLTLTFALAFGAVSAQVVLMPDSTNNRLVAFNPTDGSLVNSTCSA